MFDSAVVNEGLGQAAAYSKSGRGQHRGMSGSPDGLGAYVVPEVTDPNYPYPLPTESSPNPPSVEDYQETQNLPVQMSGPIDWLEPADTSSGAATKSAGFTLLFVALTAGVGFALRGGLGASAGLLLGAGMANGYRAQKWWDAGEPGQRHEAIVSTVFAVAEAGAGAYVAYKAYQEPKK